MRKRAVSSQRTRDKAHNDLDLLLENFIDFEERRIYLFDQIDIDSIPVIIVSIQKMAVQNKNPIHLYILSPGGNLDYMFGLYDVIRTSKAPIYTYGMGEVCSAAFVILAAGHKRFAYEACMGMHHLLTTGLGGDAKDIDTQKKAMDVASKRHHAILGLHTKKTAKYWKDRAEKDREIWLTSEELLNYGVVDEILENTPPPNLRSRK